MAVRPGLGAADAGVVVVVVQVERGQVRGVDVPDGQVLEAHGTATFITSKCVNRPGGQIASQAKYERVHTVYHERHRSHPVRLGGGGWLRQA